MGLLSSIGSIVWIFMDGSWLFQALQPFITFAVIAILIHVALLIQALRTKPETGFSAATLLGWISTNALWALGDLTITPRLVGFAKGCFMVSCALLLITIARAILRGEGFIFQRFRL